MTYKLVNKNLKNLRKVNEVGKFPYKFNYAFSIIFMNSKNKLDQKSKNVILICKQLC